MAGQTISDRFLAAKHSIAGQGLAKSVCKATTEELLGPKKKHLDYLVHCTNEPNVSIPQLANLLIERAQNTNWIVVFKALITVHHLLCYGNERFTQYLASSNSSFQLGNFLDKSGVQGYDMSPFIRRYARYLNEKALSYRTIAFDFCKVKRGKEEGVLRTMNAEKLLKTLPVLQSQLDALLEFDCSAGDLSNAVITVAFRLLFRDLIRLFAGYNDSIINLLEKYFDMNKKQCRDALDLYKKFLIRMDRVGEFLKVAENVGIDKGEIPDLTKAPSSLLDALEQHLSMLEGKKAASKAPAQAAATQRTDVKTGVNALTSTSSSFGTAAAAQPSVMDETVTKQALEEEEAVMNQYKAKVQSPVSATNPFLNAAAPVASEPPIVDLFSTPSNNISPAKKASDDLLQLGNPFADLFAGATTSSQVGVTNGAASTVWTSNGFQSTNSMAGGFVDDQSFSSVFGETFQASSTVSTTAANTGPITTPSIIPNILSDPSEGISSKLSSAAPPRPPPPISRTASPSPLISDDISNLQSTSTPLFASPSRFTAGAAPPVTAGKVLTGDLDSSLASLAENLTIDKGQQQTKGIQWNSPKNTAKPSGGTGGVMWTPQPMAATTGANYRPMVQGMPSNPPPMTTFPSYGIMPAAPVTVPMMRPQVPPGVVPQVVPVTQSNNSLDPFGTF